MVFYRWIYPEFDPEDSREMQTEYGLSPFSADILAARGTLPWKALELFSNEEALEDPFALPDMEKSVRLIEKAIDEGERIGIYGDYDCDGVVATVILYSYLQSMGADVVYRLPERDEEGYGLNPSVIDDFCDMGVTLLITVDNGISAFQEVSYAKERNLSVIVTDHHQIGDRLPDACAVVNPHRTEYHGESKDLCGAGVAFKLIAAMEGGDYESAFEAFGSLAAIATVGDVVPLQGENRRIVQRGLAFLSKTDNFGLSALLKEAGIQDRKMTAQRAAFGIVPRINAAGRMGSAKLAARLLLSEDEEEAALLAKEIEEHNRRRKNEEEIIFSAVQAVLEAHPEILLDRVLVIPVEGVNHGVVGIVSARLVSLYGKPNILLSVDGDTAVGSGRSVEFFSLYKALCACDDLLEKYGGHTMAAGLTIKAEYIPAFRERINEYAKEAFDRMPAPSYRIDKILHASDISVAAVSELDRLEPFGEGNPLPVFLLQNGLIEELIPLSENRHLKIKVNLEGSSVFVLYFKMALEQFPYAVGDRVDILANLELNTFRGNVSIAVKLKDIRPSGFSEKKILNADYYYGKLRRGETVEPKIAGLAVPSVEELRTFYRYLKKVSPLPLSVASFYLASFLSSWNYCKYRLALDILADAALIRLSGDLEKIELLPVNGKVAVEDSPVYRRLLFIKEG